MQVHACARAAIVKGCRASGRRGLERGGALDKGGSYVARTEDTVRAHQRLRVLYAPRAEQRAVELVVVPRGANQVRNVESERRVNIHVSRCAEGAKTRKQITRENGGGRLLGGRRGLGRRPRVRRLRGEIRSVRLSSAGMQGDGHAERKFVELQVACFWLRRYRFMVG
jgi:hypothetical protein